MPAPLVHSLSTLGVSEGLDHDRLADQNERRALDDLMTLAAARLDLFRIGLELERLATLIRLDLEHVGFLARDKPDHAVVVGGLDHRHAAAGALELGDFVGFAVCNIAL